MIDQLSIDEYPLYAGEAPHVVGSDTSLDAAQRIRTKIGPLHEQILALFTDRDWTCDELELETGLKHQTLSARVRELVMLDKIEDSKQRRKTRSGSTARVYILCEKESLW